MRPGRNVETHDLSDVVDTDGFRESSAREIQRGVIVSGAKEAVGFGRSIVVGSHDLADVVYSASIGTNRARYVKGGVPSVAQQQSVTGVEYSVTGGVRTRDLAHVINACGYSLAETGHVERGVAAAVAEEAMILGGRIQVIAH